jgi:uncharacterized protein
VVSVVLGLCVGAAVLVMATPAYAHVTITAPGATRGGSDQEITFRVPVEKNVDTTAVTISLPTATPIASVLVEPMRGWTHKETISKLAKPIVTDDGDITEAITQISWTATSGNGLKPGEFGAFTIIAGRLPDVASIKFSALQTYADGSVVRWNQTAAPGSSAEPEDPAPVLTLPASTGSSASGGAPTATTATTAKSASDTGPIVLSVVALVLAAGALCLVVLGRARRSAAANDSKRTEDMP